MTRLEVQDEQDFLRIHYDILGREASKRGLPSSSTHTRNHSNVTNTSSSAQSASLENDAVLAAARFFGSPGVVGPTASTSLSLPTVERALQRDAGVPSLTTALNQTPAPPMNRRESARGTPAALTAFGLTSPPLSAGMTSPNLSASSNPGGPQNEVLANFFKGLLSARSERGSSDGSAPTPARGAKPSAGQMGDAQTVAADARAGSQNQKPG